MTSQPQPDQPRAQGDIRVELAPAKAARDPRIEVFQVADRACPCSTPLSNESTTDGGW